MKVHGCMDFLNAAIFGVNRDKNITTQEVFNFLLRSFHTAHTLILQEEAQLTTLTACVILPFDEEKNNRHGKNKITLAIWNKNLYNHISLHD